MTDQEVMNEFTRLHREVFALKAEIARLTAALSRAEKALQPFANCVFNDNGDVTVTTHYLQIEDYMRAHTALSSISEPVK